MGITLIACLITLSLNLIFPRGFDFVNGKLNDLFFHFRYRLWGVQKVDEVFVHVDLTDSDIVYLDLPSWDRSVYYKTLDILHESDIAMIGVDILFQNRLGEGIDEKLIASTGARKNVYYPVVLEQHTDEPALYSGHEPYTITPTILEPAKIPYKKVLYTPFDDLISAGKGLGYINCTPDPDGINRKIPLIYAHGGDVKTYIPSMAFRIICDYLQVSDENIHITAGKHIVLKDARRPGGKSSDITIPIDNEGRMIINWPGPWDKAVPHYSVKKLLLSDIEPMFKDIMTRMFKDKIVIVSDTSLKSKDQGIGMYRPFFPLSSIHSTVMNTILTQNFMRSFSLPARILLLVLLMTVLCLAACYLSPTWFRVSSVLICLCYMIVSFIMFVFFNRQGFLYTPGMAVILATIGISWYNTYEIIKDKVTLSERSKLKTNFFINIAHETKTPLTLIMTYLDSYIKEHGMNEKLIVIKQNIDKLKADMVNFMDAEALNMGRTIYKHDSVLDLATFIGTKAVIFEELYAHKNITLTTKLPDAPVYARLHPGALDRIINNLLDNALKYGNEGGETTIFLERTDNTVSICISDTGIGIPPEELEHIFTPYYQVSRDKQSSRGMGMGLYIVKQIINEIGGTFTVQSIPGKGSTFTITLPALDAGGTPAVTDTKISNFVSSPSPVTNPTIHERPFDNQKYTIMIVEDNRQILAALHNALSEDYNVLYAANGVEALQKLETSEVPKLIVSDIIMDRMDGYTFYKKLLKNSKYHRILFIFITARSGHNEKLKALQMGAVDFISKPFHMEELEAKIASLIDTGGAIENDSKERREEEKQGKQQELFNYYKITPSERKVITHLLTGLQNNEIADELNIKLPTVTFHLRNVYRKCSVQNRVELVNLFNL